MGVSICRPAPLCPGCPPRFLPEAGFSRRLSRSAGLSADAGLLEFEEFCPSRAKFRVLRFQLQILSPELLVLGEHSLDDGSQVRNLAFEFGNPAVAIAVHTNDRSYLNSLFDSPFCN